MNTKKRRVTTSNIARKRAMDEIRRSNAATAIPSRKRTRQGSRAARRAYDISQAS